MLDLETTSMALDGDAVARVGDLVVLVPLSLPGERVRARIESVTRKFARARILQVLRPSKHRVEPRCRHFGSCGGCSWQHIAYPEQLRLKRELLASALERTLGDAAPAVRPVLGPGGAGDVSAPWGFRNKVHFVLGSGGGGLVAGHFRRSSRTTFEAAECPVHPEKGNEIAFRVRDLLRKHGVPGTDPETLRGIARHLVVRVAEGTAGTQTTIVCTRSKHDAFQRALGEIAGILPGNDGLHVNVHREPGPFLFGPVTKKFRGDERLGEKVGGVVFSISPRSFFQTCIRSAERLVEIVLGCIPADGGAVLDLYAGTGLFSLPLALRGHGVIAVEENPVSVADGIESLRRNGLDRRRCRFLRARTEDAPRLVGRPEEGRRYETVVLDPPREGCPPGTLEWVFRGLRPARVVYVSCNPRALAGDLKLAAGDGYRASRVEPVDMFPHTAHIEAVALLESGR